MGNQNNTVAELHMQTVYVDPIGRIYVPHYFKANTFVGPGKPPKEYSATRLEKNGLKKSKHPLWRRGWE